ncbi:hypothetical protein R3P38DRAFT_2789634 [Favolaschia claudopus]|uniref:Uncharacterized protein n=1 Tax=Favolaschia claudopus TaxID=2862362 RepID=A0AAW0A2J4_9AGAR
MSKWSHVVARLNPYFAPILRKSHCSPAPLNNAVSACLPTSSRKLRLLDAKFKHSEFYARRLTSRLRLKPPPSVPFHNRAFAPFLVLTSGTHLLWRRSLTTVARIDTIKPLVSHLDTL